MIIIQLNKNIYLASLFLQKYEKYKDSISLLNFQFFAFNKIYLCNFQANPYKLG